MQPTCIEAADPYHNSRTYELRAPSCKAKSEVLSIGTQDNLQYHIGSAVLRMGGPELPVRVVLSHTRGQVNAETFYNHFNSMRPGKPNDKGNFTDPTVHFGQILMEDFWLRYEGPVNCMIGEVYELTPTQVTVTEETDTYKSPPGKETQQVKWVSRAEEIAAGLPPTGHYTASMFIQQLDYLLEQQDSKAAGSEGYCIPLKDNLQAKFPGQFDIPISQACAGISCGRRGLPTAPGSLPRTTTAAWEA